ncbi:uncharacterized protein LOC114520444 [Dendronephthya gigantea]|uniref:uncharacterized protein LOC114520444 n=1 Tax=Dendronephthya gigantea TaxID=151771 RepID=UPI001069FAD9|nr:uncharacterized protein LOC114520444 [Dendronephthya gigantea]
MLNRAFLLKCAAFLSLGLALQVYQLNAKALVKLQGVSLDLKTMTPSKTMAPTAPYQSTKSDGTPPAPSVDEMKTPPTPDPSEITFTDHVNTQGQVITSPTVDLLPPAIEPPCWKKRKEIMNFFSKFAMLGLPQDYTPPRCDDQGYYKPLQCTFAGCHCVDKNGNPTSDFSPYSRILDCETENVLNSSPSQ